MDAQNHGHRHSHVHHHTSEHSTSLSSHDVPSLPTNFIGMISLQNSFVNALFFRILFLAQCSKLCAAATCLPAVFTEVQGAAMSSAAPCQQLSFSQQTAGWTDSGRPCPAAGQRSVCPGSPAVSPAGWQPTGRPRRRFPPAVPRCGPAPCPWQRRPHR